jgi:ankyrin repeat protein
LLKVSGRAYEKRRTYIEEHGYRGVVIEKENTTSETEVEAEEVKQKPGARQAAYLYEEMMKKKQEEKPILVRSGRRWTRPKSASANATNYQDWKWGLARRKRAAKKGRMLTANMPFDRRASWLVHLPARESSINSLRYASRESISSNGQILTPVTLYEGPNPDLLSPCQLKFEQIVSKLQEHHVAPLPEDDAMNVTARYLNHLPNSEPIESPRVVRRPRRSLEMVQDDEPDLQIVRRNRNSGVGELYEQALKEQEQEALRVIRRHPAAQEVYEEMSEEFLEADLPPHFRREYSIGARYEEFPIQTRENNANVQKSRQSVGKDYEVSIQKQQQYQEFSTPERERSRASVRERYQKAILKEQEEQALGVIRRRRADEYKEESSCQEPIDLRASQRREEESVMEPFEQANWRQHQDDREPLQVVRRARSSIGEQYEAHLQNLQQSGRLSEATSSGPRNSIVDHYETHLQNLRQNGRLSEATSIGSGTSDFFATMRGMQEPVNADERSSRQSRSVLGPIPESHDQSNPTTQEQVLERLRRSNDALQAAADSRSSTGRDGRHMQRVPDRREADQDSSNVRNGQSSRFQRLTVSVDREEVGNSDDSKTPRTLSREKGALLDDATPTSMYSDVENERPSERNSAVSATSSFRQGAAKVAGGFFQMVTGKKSVASDDGSDLRAVDSFRKSRSDRRQREDDATSASSFRALPEGFRKMLLGSHFATGDTDSPANPLDNEDGKLDAQPGLELMNPSSSSTGPPSPSSRSPSGRYGINSVSPEHGRIVHQRVMGDSALFGDAEADHTIIDTDDTTSDASGSKMDPETAAGLLLSPTILTKRHQQAIKAIERRNWEQVTYLVHANPWLAEMMEVTTEQFLLHKLALYGASKFLWTDTNHAVDVVPAAPQDLNQDMVRMFPSSVHKFDQDGNLPLHMAAASGNVEMSVLLGERFPSGASVRNNDGMLPLHLAVQACATPLANAHGELVNGVDFVALILQMFPGALAVPDSEGDLPLHIAAAALEGEVGVEIIYLLQDEADRLAKSENGLRFVERTRPKADEESLDDNTIDTESPTDSSALNDEIAFCNLVKNDMGRTALVKAIEAGSGWEVIEAIARGPGGVKAALMPDADKNNALHLLLNEEFGDPQAALSILKMAPQTVTSRNSERLLPIEIACRNEMPEEVILAMVLVDSPVDLTNKENVKIKDGFGDSWCFLTCESDDQYVDLVEEVISICSHEQLHELCFAKNRSGVPLINRATPLCRKALQQALVVGQRQRVDGLYKA